MRTTTLRSIWFACLMALTFVPIKAQTADTTAMRTKLTETATYLAKRLGYPNDTTTVRRALKTAYDTYNAKTEWTSEELTDLTTKLTAFRTSTANIVYPTSGRIYTFKVQGLGTNATTSGTVPHYLYNEPTNTNSMKLATEVDAANAMRFYFRLDAGTAANTFSLYNIGTSKYLAQKKPSATREIALFEAQGDGRFKFKPTSGSSRNYYVGWVPTTSANYNHIDQWGAASTKTFVYWEFEEIPLITLTVAPNTASAKGVYTWNGNTFVNRGSVTVDPAETITTPALTGRTADEAFEFLGFTNEQGDTITQLTAVGSSTTVTANFRPAFYSSSYGEKWVRVLASRNQATGWRLDDGTTIEGLGATNRAVDLSDERFLWCFVGDETGFKIYNKAVGDSYAFTMDTAQPVDGTLLKMTAAANAKTWVLAADYVNIATDPGYVFKIQGTSPTVAPNAYGGVFGGTIKCHSKDDGGSHWFLSGASIEANIAATVSNAPAVTKDTQIGAAVLTYGVAGSNVRSFLKINAAQKLYLPKYSAFSVRIAERLRNYNFVSMTNGTMTGDTLSYDSLTANQQISLSFSFADSLSHYVFYSPSEAGVPYRIPAITVAPNGDIIAVSDYRYNKQDIGFGSGIIDVVARVSQDGGSTWGAQTTVVRSGGTAQTRGYGDAALTADRVDNKALLMLVSGDRTFWNSTPANSMRVVRIEGNYDSTSSAWTWSAPEDLTNHFFNEVYANTTDTLKSLFFASGRLLQSRVVKINDYYRIYGVIATREGRVAPNTNYTTDNRVVYTDDFGRTWKILGDAAVHPIPNGDEAKVEELSDGTILLSSRAAGFRRLNVFTFGNNETDIQNGVGTWATPVEGIRYGNNACDGELYLVHATRKADSTRVLLGLHSVPTSGRTNVSIFYKEITDADKDPATFGQGWTKKLQVSNTASAYSTMDQQKDGRFAFLLEENSYDGGYNIVYFPISVDSITNGEYTLDVTQMTDSAGYAGLYVDYPALLAEGTQAYTAVVAADSISLTPYPSRYLAPNTAVLVKAAPNAPYSFQECRTVVPAQAENMLMGTSTRKRIFISNEQAGFYSLGYEDAENKEATAGFFLPAGTNVATAQTNFWATPYSVFLRVPNAVSTIRGFRFNGSAITGITTARIDSSTDKIFDLQGRQLENVKQTGIYIVNGKKVVIK